MTVKILAILLPVVFGLVSYQLSAWRTQRLLARQSTPLHDADIDHCLDDFAQVLKLDGVEAHIYEISPINGLAAPNGQVYVTRGLFNCYRRGEVSAPELASVIAHELGHVALGHTRRRMADFAGQNAARLALGMVLNRFLPGLGHALAAGLVRLIASRMSRSDEYAADTYASALMIKAGLGTAPQISLLSKLDHLTGDGGGTIAWLMSHPKTDKRIEEIRKREKSWRS